MVSWLKYNVHKKKIPAINTRNNNNRVEGEKNLIIIIIIWLTKHDNYEQPRDYLINGQKTLITFKSKNQYQKSVNKKKKNWPSIDFFVRRKKTNHFFQTNKKKNLIIDQSTDHSTKKIVTICVFVWPIQMMIGFWLFGWLVT